MNRPFKVLPGVITEQSERTVLLGTVLLVSVVSAAMGYLLTQWFAVDVISSHLANPQDCDLDWSTPVGRHCFSDYGVIVSVATRPNPWEPYLTLPWSNQPAVNQYPAAAMIPHMLFGLPAKWLGAPLLGLMGYLLALTAAVLSPAIWAARGAAGLERVVVFVALGAAAIPAWAVIDRGNSVGFVVPIALGFLVALRRQRWGMAAGMVVLAAVIKPQFAVLVLALFAVRQWRLGGLAVAGVVASNIGAYLLWPQSFPGTISQSLHNIGTSGPGIADIRNVSFGRALLLLPDMVKAIQTGGKIPDGFLAGPRSLIGYAVLALIAVSLLALGRRIPPVLAGVVLLAAAVLCTPQTNYYYLAFALPVAAVTVRDPDGPPGAGLFDQLAVCSGRRRAVGISVTLAAALTVAQTALPGPIGQIPVYGQHGANGVIGSVTIVQTSVFATPFLWLIACAVIIVSFARRPAHSSGGDQVPVPESTSDIAVTTSSGASEPTTE
ncbi:hypothetical protein A5709_07490 [Mycobacterium sp. E1386]|uniref:glycosyltransferase family 87 protein n=1 Tax=Mycobacterium sp. E1386 TaxID=1834126 RepID=UPI0008015D50|nr:glycosyltransferase family 87 protein [Mycobacterium sp. E1386]OBI26227.1 hypothetical protein A5709_07490 [Mycobacterium sp. E1386]